MAFLRKIFYKGFEVAAASGSINKNKSLCLVEQ